MKAIRVNEFGGPDVMKLEEIERPAPAADEVLVKVYASGINPVDRIVCEGGNDALRSFLKLPLTPGWDAAGVVEATGTRST